MDIRSRRRITYAALAGVLALGGTGLTIGVATAQPDKEDPGLTMVEEAAAEKDGSMPAAATPKKADPAEDGESEEISVADEADDAEGTEESSSETGEEETGEEETGTESESDSETESESEPEDGEESDESESEGAEEAEPSEEADLEAVEGEEVTDTTDAEEEQATAELTAEQARCPFTTIYQGSVKQMLTKREGGARTKAYNAGEKTKRGKDRKIVTIGIGFNMSRGDARTIVNRILSETSPQSEQADIKSGKAFDDLKAGVTELTEEQVSMLFEVSYEEAKDLVTRRGIESFDKMPRAVQAALIDVAYMRPGNINDIADEVNLASQAATAKKQSLSSANYEAAAKRLETFGRVAAKRGQGGNKIRFDQDAAMLRNKC
ncbi:hypothetical protein AB0I81_39180 [Nonomuraea sp. NPDC050404]|uniref:hypothetical protein n=1 Tax=Nonomuraea sp. NPDC050404 TaxID=3155783 RepID=UPI00340A3D77